jgi:hypothetical protein
MNLIFRSTVHTNAMLSAMLNRIILLLLLYRLRLSKELLGVFGV